MSTAAPDKPIAIVLGGTKPHLTLIQKLKDRGYFTILVDYNEEPPAKVAADTHVKASTLDQDFVLKLAREVGAKLVISACVDQANVTACYVAEQLGLPAPYSYRTSLDVTNKLLMKQRMQESGIPTARFAIADETCEPSRLSLNYPLVVKPVDCNGSKGVRRAHTQVELEKHLKSAIELSRTRRAIVEEYNDGVNVDAIFFLEKSGAQLIMTRERFMIKVGGGEVMQYYQSIVPARISERAMMKTREIAKQIAQAFGLNNTPLQIQLVVVGDEPKVIEFAPRVGGGLSYRTVKLSTGFDIIDSTIDSYLGVEVAVVRSVESTIYSENNIYAYSGVFGSLSGQDEVLETGYALEFHQYKQKGMTIGSDLTSRDRVGAFIVRGESIQEVLEKAGKCREMIEVHDIEGRPITRKNLGSLAGGR